MSMAVVMCKLDHIWQTFSTLKSIWIYEDDIWSKHMDIYDDIWIYG